MPALEIVKRRQAAAGQPKKYRSNEAERIPKQNDEGGKRNAPSGGEWISDIGTADHSAAGAASPPRLQTELRANRAIARQSVRWGRERNCRHGRTTREKISSVPRS